MAQPHCPVMGDARRALFFASAAAQGEPIRTSPTQNTAPEEAAPLSGVEVDVFRKRFMESVFKSRFDEVSETALT